MTGLLRTRKRETKVSAVELFFDLVFVFAVTQLSHSLLAHPTLIGALHTVMLLMGVWWVWMYTSWVTNWLDPEKSPVRLMLFALMAVGLFLSMSIPEAWEGKGLVFAAAYVLMQVGRSLFGVAAFRKHSPANFRNFIRITIWMVASGVFWITGGLSEGDYRLGFWLAALAIEYAGPSFYYAVPGLGRALSTDWDIDGGHMAERCGLFVIIALGESILITGATAGELAWTAPVLAGFASAFLGAVAMWWIYFNIGAERGSHVIAHSADPGAVARAVYTYGHLPIVAGIIVTAAGDELVLAHPLGHTDIASAAMIVGGPFLYMLGNLLFKMATGGWPPLSHMVGMGALAILGALSLYLPPLGLTGVTTAILVIVAIWETVSLRSEKSELAKGVEAEA